MGRGVVVGRAEHGGIFDIRGHAHVVVTRFVSSYKLLVPLHWVVKTEEICARMIYVRRA